MKELQLKELLMAEARRGGICADGFAEMRTDSLSELVDYYVANPDWCMERGFPSLEILRNEFSDCGEKGVYVGRSFNGEVLSEKQAYIFHDCKGTIKVAMDYENAVIPMLYFANGCNMTISCDQPNNPPIRVPLYVTDEGDNSVSYIVDDNCKFVRHTIKLIEI